MSCQHNPATQSHSVLAQINTHYNILHLNAFKSDFCLYHYWNWFLKVSKSEGPFFVLLITFDASDSSHIKTPNAICIPLYFIGPHLHLSGHSFLFSFTNPLLSTFSYPSVRGMCTVLKVSIISLDETSLWFHWVPQCVSSIVPSPLFEHQPIFVNVGLFSLETE